MHKVISAVILLAGMTALAAEAPKPNPETVILDLNDATFRVFYGWKTPTLIAPDGTLKPVLERKRAGFKDEDRKPVPVLASDPPAANWAALDFDDSAWPKLEVNQPAWRPRLQWAALNARGGADAKYHPGGVLEGNLVCLRGTFEVFDPAKVTDLKLTLGYFGGAVVYVNGVELQRGHLPEGKLTFGTLATRYPDEAYLLTNSTTNKTIRGYAGNWIYGYWGDVRIHTNMLNGMKVWRRELPAKGASDGVSIPATLLREGVNVIGIAVYSSPVNELFYEKTVGDVTWSGDNNSPFPHAMVVDARLTASSAVGLGLSEAVSGIQLVNNQLIETVTVNERVLPSAQVCPIRMVGARNGVFSGKVLLTSSSAIRNLRATASELTRAGSATSTGSGLAISPQGGVSGSIPVAATQVRWAAKGEAYLDPLSASFPTNLPVGSSKQALGAVWITVRVPADSPAGQYKGALTIEAEGAAPVTFTVPVQLKVNDWRIPDPKHFVIHHNIYQSPDSVARYYNVPLWSDKHFELMGKSLNAFGEVGNKLCVVNLLADSFTLGNSEGMVRWVKKEVPGVGVQVSGDEEKGGPGAPDTRQPTPETFSYDFTVADKYMDLYEKTCGKPGVLRLDAWQRTSDAKSKIGQLAQCVSVLDPATGKVEPMPQPAYGTPENEAFWKPVLTELRKRLEKRGWFDVAAFGWVHYSKPADPQLVDVFKRIWPDGKWMHTAHTFPTEYQGTIKDIKMPVLCCEGVWGVGPLYNPDDAGQRLYGQQYPRRWKGPKNILLGFPRMGVAFIDGIYDQSNLALYRTVTEAAIQGNISGLGYLGGDFWPVQITKDRRGLVSWSGQGIGMTDAITACFSPGPDGAIFNERMEAFREGVQVGEAILFLERALEDKKVSGAMERKIGNLLNERARYYLRGVRNFRSFECSTWQERDDRLFALCAEAAAETGARH